MLLKENQHMKYFNRFAALIALVPALTMPGRKVETKAVNTMNHTTMLAKNNNLGFNISIYSQLVKDIVSGTINSYEVEWGRKICSTILSSFGIDILENDPVADQLKEINSKLSDIEAKLAMIDSKIDHSEGTRILDTFMGKANKIETSLSPIMAAYATLVDEEQKSDDPKLLKAAENFYTNYVANLKYGNSFSEKVIELADAIVSPSSDSEWNLMRCFDVAVCDSAKLTWDSMRIKPKEDFSQYLSILLFHSIVIAKFEISYKLAHETDTQSQAFWKQAEKDMEKATKPAFEKLKSFLEDVEENSRKIEEDDIITHIPTDTQVSTHLAALSFDPSLGRNVLSYHDTYRAYPACGGMETGYERKNLHVKDSLIDAVSNEYQDYVAAYQKKDYSLFDYLREIGFTSNKKMEDTIGIYHKFQNRHEGGFFTDEYDYYEVHYIGKEGKKETTPIGTVIDKCFQSLKYEKGEGYSKYFLTFLQPKAEKVFGDYDSMILSSYSQDKRTKFLEPNLPYTFNYQDALNDGSLGKVSHSW